MSFQNILSKLEIVVQFVFDKLGITRLDAGQTIRFCIVGVEVALIYIGLYYFFSRGLNIPIWIASGVAFLIAIAAQYLLHARFTFRKRARNSRQLGRFVFTVGIGLIFSSVLTGVIWPLTGAAEIWALLIVIITLPVINLVLFTLWVYAKSDV